MNNCLPPHLARITPKRYDQWVAYNPPKRLTDKEIALLCRIFGIDADKLVETAERVEAGRCDECGRLRCRHA